MRNEAKARWRERKRRREDRWFLEWQKTELDLFPFYPKRGYWEEDFDFKERAERYQRHYLQVFHKATRWPAFIFKHAPANLRPRLTQAFIQGKVERL